MKIYLGKNKKEAKETTLKKVMYSFLELKDAECKPGRFNDNSASWINIRLKTKTGVIDACIAFNPETDNEIVDVSLFESKWVLDEDNMRNLLK